MERLEFNNKVERIEQYAFGTMDDPNWLNGPHISTLNTFKLPDNLQYIDRFAFEGQAGLRIVYMTGDVRQRIGYGVPPFDTNGNFNSFDGSGDDYNYKALGQPFYTDISNYPSSPFNTNTWLQTIAYTNEEIQPMHIEPYAVGSVHTSTGIGSGSANRGFFNNLATLSGQDLWRDAIRLDTTQPTNYGLYFLEKKNNDTFYGSHEDLYNRNEGWITEKAGNIKSEPQPSTDSVTDNVGTISIFTDIDGNSYSRLISGQLTPSDYQNYVAKENIRSITIGSAVTDISDDLFKDASQLQTVIMSNSVNTIGNSAFENCTNLHSVILSNTLINLPESVFNGCTSLNSITIPSSVTTIHKNAFDNCTNLQTIALSDNLVTIQEMAFVIVNYLQ